MVNETMDMRIWPGKRDHPCGICGNAAYSTRSADPTSGVACGRRSNSVLRAILIANRQRTRHYEGATVQELGRSYWCLK
jgi:hypothetical protein